MSTLGLRSKWKRPDGLVGATQEEQRQAYVEDFECHEGIQLDPTKIAYNPGRRSLANLMLNS